MRLMLASPLLLSLSVLLFLLTACLEVGAVVLIVAKLVAVEVICDDEVLPYRLRGGAAFRATS